tara:strand:- start:827 stop:1243 length:417 start_codon:yes stop_codon:yes gene_type:complete
LIQEYFYKNKWWLISNIDRSCISDPSSQLHIFYSSNPLSKDWKPHKNNPVIFDPLTGRNGGLIVDESEIYRVYQRHGFNNYGEAFGVSKIYSLDDKSYFEKKLFEVEPKFFSNIKGSHTYNYVEGLLVFDYVEINSKK